MKSWLNVPRFYLPGWREREASAVVVVLFFCAQPVEAAEDKPAAAGPPIYHVPVKVIDAVMAKLPKYSPPPPKPPSEPGDALLAENASDDVLRMPRFEVTVEKTYGPSNAWLTDKGRLDKALKKYPGLGFGPLAFLNAGLALEMLKEEEEEARRTELTDLVTRTTTKDDARSRETAKMARDATMNQNNDWYSRPAGGPLK